MAELTVIAHNYDPWLEVYRLTVGYMQPMQVAVLDETGQPVFEPGEVIRTPRIKLKLDENGQPLVDAEGHPTGETFEDPDDVTESVTQGAQLTQEQLVGVPVEDFVFSQYDERWVDLSDEQIVGEQRRLVRETLRQRAADAAAEATASAEAAATLVNMPGIGEGL